MKHGGLRAAYFVFGVAPVSHMLWWLCRREINDWFEGIVLGAGVVCLSGMLTACVVPLPAKARIYWPVAAVLGTSAMCLSSMAALGGMAFGGRVEATLANALHLVWCYVAPSLVAFHFIFRAQEVGMAGGNEVTE